MGRHAPATGSAAGALLLFVAVAARSTSSGGSSSGGAAYPHGGGACSGPLDCQLNGACTGGKCVCGAAWTGANCSRLDFLPATKGAGFYTANSSWSSWGNMVSRDPQSGKYYMAADEMANHCGLGTWGRNSRCVMAEAETAAGPYRRVSVVVDPWCHGTWMDRDPVSGRWIFGHMGSGKPSRNQKCKTCTDGITPANATPTATCTCPRESTVPVGAAAGALIATSPLGPWKSAGPHLVNGANCVPFFQPNGTLYFACPWGAKVADPSCNSQNAGMALSRAESLDHALAGNYTYKGVAPKMRLGGTNASNPCVNWEGNMVWVDSSGYFHSLAHAFRGQPTQYPLPGCHFPGTKPVPPGDNTCTALGGHAYSIDGVNWFISPVAPFNSTIRYTDGSELTFRARER
eukprot:COSAG06_NODE_12584_length_1360_cov_22.281014_1_plen_402_part_01